MTQDGTILTDLIELVIVIGAPGVPALLAYWLVNKTKPSKDKQKERQES